MPAGGAAFKRATPGYDRCMYIGLGTLLVIIIILVIVL
jgi:hypothetical protein